MSNLMGAWLPQQLEGNIGFVPPFTGNSVEVFGTIENPSGAIDDGDLLASLSPAFPAAVAPDHNFNFLATAEKPGGGDMKIVLKVSTDGNIYLERGANGGIPSGCKIFVYVKYWLQFPAIAGKLP